MSKLWTRVSRVMGGRADALAAGDSPGSALVRSVELELAEALRCGDGAPGEDVRAAMAILERFFHDRVVPRMIVELGSKSVDVRRSAISVLRSAGASAAYAIPALLSVVERDTESTDACTQYARKEAAYAIEEIRRACQRAIEEADRREREGQANTAAAPGASAPATTSDTAPDETTIALLSAMDDQVAAVRMSAIDAVVRRGQRQPEVMAALRSALRDASADVRERAALAIGQLS